MRNYAARNFMKEMKKGDQVLYYHSNEGLEIVGIAKSDQRILPGSHYRWGGLGGCNPAPYKKLKRPVGLAQIKTDKRLANMAQVRLGRLSVGPVTKEEWAVADGTGREWTFERKFYVK